MMPRRKRDEDPTLDEIASRRIPERPRARLITPRGATVTLLPHTDKEFRVIPDMWQLPAQRGAHGEWLPSIASSRDLAYVAFKRGWKFEIIN